MIAMTSPLLFSVRGYESSLRLLLPPSFVLLSALDTPPPPGLLHLQLLAPRDEGGCGGISYRYMCCFNVCLFCTVIIQAPGSLLQTVPGNRM